MPEEVFRFLTIRAPQRATSASEARRVLRPFTERRASSLGADLAGLKAGGATRAKLIERAATFLHSSDFAYGQAPLEFPIDRLDQWLLAQPAPIDPGILRGNVESLYGSTIPAIIGSSAFTTTARRIADTGLALAVVHYSQPELWARSIRHMRLVALLERLAVDGVGPRPLDALDAAVVLPADIFPLPVAEDPRVAERAAARQQRTKDLAQGQATLAQIVERIEALKGARTEIANAFTAETSELRRTRPSVDVDRAPMVAAQTRRLFRRRAPDARRAATADLVMAEPFFVGGAKPAPVMLSAGRAGALSERTRTALARLGISSNDGLEVIDSSAAIDDEIKNVSGELARNGVSVIMARLGGEFVPAAFHASRDATRASGTPGPCDEPAQNPAVDTEITVPIGAGSARFLGIGDLQIVQQEIQRYLAVEVAHIENVLVGELKDRTHRRLNRIEETFLFESEQSQETSRDLQTTERYELQRESSEVISLETRLETGVTVTASYGPSVEVTAEAGFAKERAQEEADKEASRYSREITDRAVQRIQDRVLEQRRRTAIEEIEETDRHRLDNRGAGGHVRGIYRWVHKQYKAQVMGYGKRQILEYVVPEPAAFYRHAQAALPREDATLVRPGPPGYCHEATNTFMPLTPTDLDDSNYLFWVGQYGVEDVDPPPQMYVTIGAAFSADAVEGQFTPIADDYDEIEVPVGYRAYYAWATGFGYGFDYLRIFAGRRQLNLNDNGFTVMNLEEGSVPVALYGPANGFAITIEVTCARKAEQLAAWQIETYNAIMGAYRDQKAKYDAELTRLSVAAGVEIQGRAPQLNREIERVELQRAVLSQLTDQHFDDFDAMRRDDLPPHYPQANLPEAVAEGEYIQFFQQAFEWTHMTYVFYPYFWGRKELWPRALQLDDTDPLFARFLQAGSARVQVPVRPGYEPAILHFLGTAQIWNGGDPPLIEDPLYLSIVDEIRGEQDAAFTEGVGTVSIATGADALIGVGTQFDAELHRNREIILDGIAHRVASVSSPTSIRLSAQYQGPGLSNVPYAFGARFVGSPWMVDVPTSLVYLQEDGGLPDFTTGPGA